MTAPRAPAGTAERMRVRRLLAAAELEPPGLPPASVLVVRSLADPLPGRLRPRPGDVRAPAEWEAAVRAALTERWRGAARPLRGPVPAGAAAVWFADTAEMIAAFARDAAGGDTARWWWQALLKGLPGGPLAALTALWAREARHVPAALQHLAAAGEAAYVAAALPAAYATRILGAVACAFEAPALLAAPPAVPEVSPGTRIEGGDPAVSASPPPPRARETHGGPPSFAAPPWAGFLPADEVPRGLAPEQAALLGVGLMLHRAPLVARGSAFVARFVRWRAAAAADLPASDRPPRTISPAPLPSRAAADLPREPASPAHTQVSASGDREDAASTRVSASPDLARRRTGKAGDDGRAMEIRPSPDPHPPTPFAAAEDEMRVDAPPSVPPRSDAAPMDASHPVAGREDAEAWEVEIRAAPAEEVRAASGACGVFFLVNVLRGMDFFRALDERFAIPPVVGGWGWMELVARSLLGPRAAGLADDPVWRVLAELDGRAPDEPPGVGFVPPASEALPARWIDLFRGAPPAPAPSPPLGIRVDAALAWFLDLVVPVLRARIHAALAAAGGDADEPLETALLRRIGTIEATRTHVDVHMDIDQATLPVRLAGLDANPGWVPELARVVTFHFA